MEDYMTIRSKLVYGTAGLIFCAYLILTASMVQAAATVRGLGRTPEIAELGDGVVKFSIGLGAGYLTGESKELVFWPENNNHKASELTWKIDNLYMANINGSLTIARRWFFKIDGWFKATDGDGTMDDYDWTNVGGDWTHWSHHEDTDVTEANMLDVNAGWRFINNRVLSIACLIGFKRDNFNWESYGGTYVYTDTDFRDTTGSFDEGEPAIGYEQTFRAVYTGLGFGLTLGRMFSLSARAIYSPFAECKAVDHHYMRNLVTEDELENGDMFAFDIKAILNITRHFAVDIGYSYLYYDEMQGDSIWYYYDYGVAASYPDGGGADHDSSVFSIGLTYTF